MPRCLEPGQRFPLVLRGDKDKPEGARPTFFFRGVPARQYLNAANASQEARKIEPAIEFLKANVVGWDHMNDPTSGEPIAFDAQKLDSEICDADELWELFLNFHLGAEDKKKSE